MAGSQLPTGAEALLVALATPSPRGPIGIPVLLWGRPGVGKSSFIEGLAGEDLRVTTLIASIHDPTDFSGLPLLEDGRVRYAVPRWVDDFEEAATGILFLDELSTAPPSVQAALLRVVFERRVGFHPLPDQVRIVAAANPPDLMVGGWELSPPLRNRFVHLNWEIPESLYVRSLTEGWATGELPTVDPEQHRARLPLWRVRIAGFLRLSPGALHASPEDNRYGFASPRSWDFAAALLTSCDLLEATDTVTYELVAGCLGEATAIPFLEYLRNLRLPDPLAYLEGEASVAIGELDDSEVYVLFAGLNVYLRRQLGGADDDRLLAYSRRYLDLAAATFADERRDLVFVPLKELARAGWLIELTNAARRRDDPELLASTLSAVNRLFADAGLNEFIGVLG